MTGRETAAYVLRRFWLWPLELWLRPMDLSDRIDEAPRVELIAGMSGGGFFGALIGVLVWAWTGDLNSVWVLTLVYLLAVAFVVAWTAVTVAAAAGMTAGTVATIAIAEAESAAAVETLAAADGDGAAVAEVGAAHEAVDVVKAAVKAASAATADVSAKTDAAVFCFADLRAVFVAAASAVAVAGVGAGPVAVTVAVAATNFFNSGGGIAPGALYSGSQFIVFATFGCLIGVWFDSSTVDILALGVAGGSVVSVLVWGRGPSSLKNPTGWLYPLLPMTGLPIVGFAFLPRADAAEMAQWGLGLCMALAVGVLSGSFLDNQTGIARRRSRRDQRIAAESQTHWLWYPWALCLPLALAAYALGPDTAGLNAKLDQLAFYLALTPLVLTGLSAWPFAALVALRQFRPVRGDATMRAPDWLGRTLPFRWQTCAFPLPGLRNWLLRLGREHGAAAALEAIQQVQFGTLQLAAARRAARMLAGEPQTALPFCGAVAVGTNAVTLAGLGPTGPAACAIAALWASGAKDADSPLLLDIGRKRTRLPALAGLLGAAWDRPPAADGPTLESIRKRPPAARIDYALERLSTLPNYAQWREVDDLLGPHRGPAMVERHPVDRDPPGRLAHRRLAAGP